MMRKNASEPGTPPHPVPLPEGEGIGDSLLGSPSPSPSALGEGLLISILMPMRNGEPWVVQSLQSILRQDAPLEIIVINDGSTDRSVDLIQNLNDPRIRIIPGPQRGISAAFNAGLGAATGKYIARCDCDDLYPADRLGWQAQFLEDHPENGAVCGHFATMDETDELISDHYEEFPAADITEEIRNGRSRSHVCAYLFRADVLRQLNGCREWFTTSEDADLQYRLSEITRVWFEPKRAYEYRLHSSSITHQQKNAERKFFEKMAREFQIQRQTKGADDLQSGNPPLIVPDPTAKARHASEQIQEILLSKAWREHRTGTKRAALKTNWRAIQRRPTSLSAWKSMLALLVR